MEASAKVSITVPNVMNGRVVFEALLKLYLISIIFLYPYGIFLVGEVALRIPDIFAFLAIFLGLLIVTQRQTVMRSVRHLTPIMPLVAVELLLPLIGTAALGGGIGGVANSLRMFVLWGPMLFYVLVFRQAAESDFHRSVYKILAVSIVINLIYAFLQLSVKLGMTPDIVVIKPLLQGFAVDNNFQPTIQGLRADGFFANSTGLAVFGICTLCYFLGRHLASRDITDIVLALMSCLLVLVTISRAGMAAMLLILLAYVLYSNLKRAINFLLIFSAMATVSLILINSFIGLDAIYDRIDIFLTLGVDGASQDFSFSSRIHGSWPDTLSRLNAYPYGTFVSAGAELGLIDSGYLTYYAQGKWLFLATVVFFILSSVYLGAKSLIYRDNWPRKSLFFLVIFIAGAMVVSIPLRNPITCFMILYLLHISGLEQLYRRQNISSRNT